MKKFILLLIITIFINGCVSMNSGYITGPAPAIENNFKYVNNAVGKSKLTYVFGLGGNMKEGLIRDAKNNLIANYPVNNGQILVNFTIDHKKTCILGFIWTHEVIVTADILEYTD